MLVIFCGVQLRAISQWKPMPLPWLYCRSTVYWCIASKFKVPLNFYGMKKKCFSEWINLFSISSYSRGITMTRPTLERRKTLGHLRSINRNMIIHFANQLQTSQLLKILKNNFFFKHFMKRTCEKWCNQSQVELIGKIHIDYQERHIYICRVLGITF